MRLPGPTTVGQVLAAERDLDEKGWLLQLKAGSRPLDSCAWVHVEPRLEPYVLTPHRKRQARLEVVGEAVSLALLTDQGVEQRSARIGQRWADLVASWDWPVAQALMLSRVRFCRQVSRSWLI